MHFMKMRDFKVAAPVSRVLSKWQNLLVTLTGMYTKNQRLWKVLKIAIEDFVKARNRKDGADGILAEFQI